MLIPVPIMLMQLCKVFTMSHIGNFKDNEVHSFVHYVFPKLKQEGYHHSTPQGVSPSDNSSLPFPL